MENFNIEDDLEWLDKAPTAISDPTLAQRAALVASQPFLHNENSTAALKHLLQFGLVLETESHPGSQAPLAHYLVELLNFAYINNTPRRHNFHIHLASQKRIKIPERSLFLLWHLSTILHCSIYIFSSRANPVVFTSPEANSGTVALFHHISSYTGNSEYLVLVPSPHLTSPSTDHAPVPVPFHSAIEPATYRTEERPLQQREKHDDSVLTAPVCKRVFAKAL